MKNVGVEVPWLCQIACLLACNVCAILFALACVCGACAAVFGSEAGRNSFVFWFFLVGTRGA